MKIKITLTETEKQPIPDGTHVVQIKSVRNGTSEQKGAPYFSVYFENDLYYVDNRFYYENSNTHVIIGKLFDSCGIINTNGEFETDELIGKRVQIKVKRDSGKPTYPTIYDYAKIDKVISQIKDATEEQDLPF